MPLQIGVDAWNLTGDRRGIGRYVREIVRRWAAWRRPDLRLCLLVPERAAWFARRRYLRELAGVELPVRHRGAARSLDVVWFPWNGMSWVAKTVTVATLHDASLFSLSPADEQVQQREQRPFRVAAALARRIITDSQFSKDELVRYLGLDPEAVEVIHLGVNDAFAAARATRSAWVALAPEAPRSVLFVGEPEERKGLSTLFEAMALLPPTLRAATELIIAGATGQYPMPEAPPGVRVKSVGWVTDEELARLYAQAAVLVYPSRYEGFGLPLVEAMAAGAPVIAADTPGLREAGGDAAMFVPAGDARAFATGLESVLGDPVVAARLSQRGAVRAGELSWDETARRTLAAIEQAAAGQPA